MRCISFFSLFCFPVITFAALLCSLDESHAASPGCFLGGWADIHGACDLINQDFVETAPPADKPETIPTAPGPEGHAYGQWFWEAGHWNNVSEAAASSGDWIWEPGSWTQQTLTPEDYAALGSDEIYTEPAQGVLVHWVKVRGGWKLEGGHSPRIAEYGGPYYATKPPPADKPETPSARPGAFAFWHNGYWLWVKRKEDYQWMPGAWSFADGLYVERWVPGRWEAHERGTWKGWVYLKSYAVYKFPDGHRTVNDSYWETKTQK